MKQLIFLLVILGLLVGAFAAEPEITQVTYSPSPAVPGTTITVFVQVHNNENSIQHNTTITLKDMYPFTVKEDTNKTIGDMSPQSTGLAQFVVYVDPTAGNRTYQLPVTAASQEVPNGKTVEFPIDINGNQPTLKVVAISTEQLVPGEEKETTFTVQNIGTSTAYDVLIELQEDRTIVATGTVVERQIIPIGPANTYIASIAPSEQKTATLKIGVNRNADLKNYSLPVAVSYRTASGERVTDTSYIGLNITGTVDIDAAIKDIVPAGGMSDVTIELFNRGEGKAQFMTATIDASGYIDKPKQFIGSLEPNDVDSFKVRLEKPEQVLTLTLTYQDTDATVKTKTFQLQGVTAPLTQDQGNIFGLLIPLIIILALAWFGYNKFIKKK